MDMAGHPDGGVKLGLVVAVEDMSVSGVFFVVRNIGPGTLTTPKPRRQVLRLPRWDCTRRRGATEKKKKGRLTQRRKESRAYVRHGSSRSKWPGALRAPVDAFSEDTLQRRHRGRLSLRAARFPRLRVSQPSAEPSAPRGKTEACSGHRPTGPDARIS